MKSHCQISQDNVLEVLTNSNLNSALLQNFIFFRALFFSDIHKLIGKNKHKRSVVKVLNNLIESKIVRECSHKVAGRKFYTLTDSAIGALGDRIFPKCDPITLSHDALNTKISLDLNEFCDFDVHYNMRDSENRFTDIKPDTVFQFTGKDSKISSICLETEVFQKDTHRILEKMKRYRNKPEVNLVIYFIINHTAWRKYVHSDFEVHSSLTLENGMDSKIVLVDLSEMNFKKFDLMNCKCSFRGKLYQLGKLLEQLGLVKK